MDNWLEENHFVRRDLIWYKTLPDVVLCIGAKKLRGNTFELGFGIVPFVCIPSFKEDMLCFQPEMLFKRLYGCEFNQVSAERISECKDLDDGFPSIDNTIKNLHDPIKKDLLRKRWGEVFKRVVFPLVSKVYDLASALDAIGEYLCIVGTWDYKKRSLVHERKYWPDFMPAFMKLGRINEAMPSWNSFIEPRVDQHSGDTAFIKEAAIEALEIGNYNSLFLWYYAMRNNIELEIKKIVDRREREAEKWLLEEGLVHIA